MIVEACHFLSVRAKLALLRWIERGGLGVAEAPSGAYPELARHLDQYADLDIDLADAALIWLAERAGERAVLTVDRRDFAAFRLKGRKRLELVRWYKV